MGEWYWGFSEGGTELDDFMIDTCPIHEGFKKHKEPEYNEETGCYEEEDEENDEEEDGEYCTQMWEPMGYEGPYESRYQATSDRLKY